MACEGHVLFLSASTRNRTVRFWGRNSEDHTFWFRPRSRHFALVERRTDRDDAFASEASTWADALGLIIHGRLAKACTTHFCTSLPQWYDLSVGRKQQIPHFCACAERSFQHGAMWSLASAYQIYMNQQGELPRPTQPIMSIWGAADRSHPAGNAHSLARLYDGVRTVTFDDLGHTPELEAPDLVLAEILDFLGIR